MRHQHPTRMNCISSLLDEDAAYRDLANALTASVVNLQLIPSSTSKSGIKPRRIILDDEKPYVDVGRASTNPIKNISPQTDNAVIDSPILSRVHARFEMTKKPVEVDCVMMSRL